MTAGFHPFLFYACAIGIAWTAWLPLLLQRYESITLPLPYPLVLFLCQTAGAFAPLLALVLVGRLTGEPGLAAAVMRTFRLKGAGAAGLLGAALLPVAVTVAATVSHATVSGNEVPILRPEPRAELGWGLVIVMPFTFLMGLIGSPLGEEPGWRAYVLDRMVARGRGLVGSAVVATMWWIWHVPLFIVLRAPVDLYSFLEMVGYSLLIDSAFLLSGGNLAAAMFCHQGVTIKFLFFGPATRTVEGMAVLLAAGLCVRGLAEARHDRRHRGAGSG